MKFEHFKSEWVEVLFQGCNGWSRSTYFAQGFFQKELTLFSNYGCNFRSPEDFKTNLVVYESYDSNEVLVFVFSRPIVILVTFRKRIHINTIYRI